MLIELIFGHFCVGQRLSKRENGSHLQAEKWFLARGLAFRRAQCSIRMVSLSVQLSRSVGLNQCEESKECKLECRLSCPDCTIDLSIGRVSSLC